MGACACGSTANNNSIVLKIRKRVSKGLKPLTTSALPIHSSMKASKSRRIYYLSQKFEAEGMFPSVTEEAFTEKIILMQGAELSTIFSGNRIGVACRKGLKAQVNQDNFSVLSKPPFFIAGVFDGHGPNGHTISSLLRKVLPRAILNGLVLSETALDIMKSSHSIIQNTIIEKCQRSNIDISFSGSTSTIILLHNNCLYLSQVGDSKAILLKRMYGRLSARPITVDHTLEENRENQRIQENGGKILAKEGENVRKVYTEKNLEIGLAITRTFGDLALNEVGVTHEPYLNNIMLSPADEFIVICSDGVWKVINYQEIAEIIDEVSTEEACNIIANLAWGRWIEHYENIVEDITVMILPI